MNRITLIQKDQIESELCCENAVEEILVNGEKLLQIHEVCKNVKKIVRITQMCVILATGIAILATGMVGNDSSIQQSLEQNIQVGQSQIKMKESKALLENLGYTWDNQNHIWNKNE